jgi:hypothetical protein
MAIFFFFSFLGPSSLICHLVRLRHTVRRGVVFCFAVDFQMRRVRSGSVMFDNALFRKVRLVRDLPAMWKQNY